PKQVKSLLQADITRLQEALAQEAGRRQAYPELKQRYDALPEGAKAIYTEVRDAYTERADAMQEALVQRIAGLELGEAARKDLTDRVRAHFESARVQAPYFPLARFGEYWVAAEKNGEKEFRMMENRAQQRRVQNAYAKEGWTTKAGAKLDMLQAVDGASASFMDQVTEKLNEANVDKDVTDEIYQLYLRTLPDLSVRKQFIHRKGVAGYDQDALRAFAGHMNHGAYQLSRLENSQVMETLLRTMRKDVEALSEGGGVEAVKAARAMSEVDKRHQWIMNPKDAAWVQRVSSANFAYYLGATPAAALVNVLQGAVTTFPALASKHGWVKALSALTSATNASIRTYGNIEKTLRNADERTAYEQLLAMGAIDRTLSHDLAGMG
ncbi:MAG: PLxRFG domain-containing protein, partial [Stenotrophomonas sp.]|nr:PLxRFG domain-containing protein [Stenotrophomonas sp.]